MFANFLTLLPFRDEKNKTIPGEKKRREGKKKELSIGSQLIPFSN